MIKIKLTNEQQLKLENFRKQVSSKDSEKALMVLLSNDGKSVSEIALMLKRNQHTIRDWLKRYGAQGINGLSRNFSPGRPNTMREKIKKTHQADYWEFPNQSWLSGFYLERPLDYSRGKQKF